MFFCVRSNLVQAVFKDKVNALTSIKSSLFLSMLLVGAFLFPCASIAADNLLTNPGFEAGETTGWDGNSGIVTATNPYTGTYSFELAGDPVGYPNISQTIPVVSGHTYRFSGLMSVSGLTSGNYRFQIRWYNAGGAEIGSLRQTLGNTTSDTAFVIRTVDIVADVNATSVKMVIQANKANGIGYYDDISIIDLSAAPDTSAPTIPTELSAISISTSQIDLTWSASTDVGGGTVAGYNIYRDGIGRAHV